MALKPELGDPHQSRMAEVLSAVCDFCTRHIGFTLTVAAASVAVCVGITLAWMNFKTDRADLINPSAAFHQRWLRYTENFGDASDMVVVVEASEPEQIKQTLDALGTRLKTEPQLFSNILYKVEPGALRGKGLQYLSAAQLEAGLGRLEDYRPILNGQWDVVRLENIAAQLWLQLSTPGGADEGPVDPAKTTAILHHADRLATSLAQFLQDRDEFTNPWPDLIALDPAQRDQGNQTIYLINDEGTIGFLKTTPVKKNGTFEGASAAIDRLRQIMGELRGEHFGTSLSLTGIPVLENDEMRRSKTDMGWASLISESGVAILMLICFRGFRHPLVGMLMLAIGTAWTFGFTTLVVGHLNILSVSFVTILIGLGVDFGIHFLARYLQLRHEGHETQQALVRTSDQVGTSILTGAITCALAFFCAAFTDFTGVAELGIIAGGGILLCTVATFTVLPAMVMIADRNRGLSELPVPFRGELLRTLTTRFPLVVLAVSVGLIGYVVMQTIRVGPNGVTPLVRYDHNLLNLQAKGLESVDAQTRIFQASNHSLLFAISLADSAADARRLKARFEKLPTVHHVEELGSRLPSSPPSETRLLVQAFHAQLARLPEKPGDPVPVNPAVLGRHLEQLCQHLLTRPEPLARTVATKIDRLLNTLDRQSLPDQMRALGEFQFRLAYSLLAQFQALAAASNPEPVSLDDLPPELTSRFVGKGGATHGKWLLQVFPAQQVWDMEPLTKFVNDVRSVDPEVTGTPLQNFEAALQIKRSYEIAALYSLAVITLVLLIDFLPREMLAKVLIPATIAAVSLGIALQLLHWEMNPLWIVATLSAVAVLRAVFCSPGSVAYTLLAMLPPLVSLAMTFGILVLIDMPLNPANLIILPLILGLGVDSGVHLLHDFRTSHERVYSISPSLVNAIVLTVTTTMVGFGAMMIANHRGLFSLGAVLTIGVGCCLFVSLVPLPALLSFISRQRKTRAEHGASDGDERTQAERESVALFPGVGPVNGNPEQANDDQPATIRLPLAAG